MAREAETVATLRAVQADVQALLHGPFNTGVAYLREAAFNDISGSDRSVALSLARQEFMRAIGQEGLSLSRSEAGVYLAAIWATEGKFDVGRPYVFKAALDAQNFAASEVTREHWKFSTSRFDSARESDRLRRMTLVCERAHQVNDIARAYGVPTEKLNWVWLRRIENSPTFLEQLRGVKPYRVVASINSEPPPTTPVNT